MLLLVAGPAGAGKLFSIDDGDKIQEFSPLDANGASEDDLFFDDFGVDENGDGASGPGYTDAPVSGVIRALPVFDPPVSLGSLFMNDVQSCVDFTVGACSSATSIDPWNYDFLIVDVVLYEGSVDQIGLAVGTEPGALEPAAAGWMLPCDGPLAEPDNCRALPPGASGAYQAPTGVTLIPGVDNPNPFPDFPPAVVFDFGTTTRPDSDNLNPGETTLRFFVAWDDTGADTPLAKGDSVLFMISSNGNFNVGPTQIVPEPSTVFLLGLGLAGLARAGRGRTL